MDDYSWEFIQESKKKFKDTASINNIQLFVEIKEGICLMFNLSNFVGLKLFNIDDVDAPLSRDMVMHTFFIANIGTVDMCFESILSYRLQASFVLLRSIYEGIIRTLYYLTADEVAREKLVQKLNTNPEARENLRMLCVKIQGGNKKRADDLYGIFKILSEQMHKHWNSLSIVVKYDPIWIKNQLKLLLMMICDQLMIYTIFYVDEMDDVFKSKIVDFLVGTHDLEIGVLGLFPENFKIQDISDLVYKLKSIKLQRREKR